MLWCFCRIATGLATPALSRALSILNPGSLRAELSRPRSDPEDPSDPVHPLPPFVCGAGLLRAGIYDERVRMLRMRRISRIAFRNTLPW
jgi:hypothetical protein